MGRMALLQHNLPDGTSHFDWLIERPDPHGPRTQVRERDPNERCLIAFRVVERVDQARVMKFVADRIEDHRYLYLDYQGPIAGERGSVQRQSAGVVRNINERDERTIVVRGRWLGGDEFVWTGRREGELWSFDRADTNIRVARSSKPRPDPDKRSDGSDDMSWIYWV
jgi:hypothetical protein